MGVHPSQPPLAAQQGAQGAEADAAEVVQAGPQQAQVLAYPATLLVRLARSRRRARGAIAASAPPPGCSGTTTSRSPPTAPSGTSRDEARSRTGRRDRRRVWRSFSPCSQSPCSPPHRPRRPPPSSTGSPRERSTSRTTRACRRPRCTRSASCSGGARSSRPRARSTGPTRTISSASSPRTESGRCPFALGLADLGRQRGPGPAAARQRRRPDGVEGLPDAGGGALRPRRHLLGTPPTTRSTGPSATPLPVQSWQIWNEPNLKKFFTPGQRRPVGPEVRQPAEDLPRRDQGQGPAGADRARRDARLRRLQGLGLPRQHLRGGRDQELLRRHRPAPLRAATSTSFAARSSCSAPR